MFLIEQKKTLQEILPKQLQFELSMVWGINSPIPLKENSKGYYIVFESVDFRKYLTNLSYKEYNNFCLRFSDYITNSDIREYTRLLNNEEFVLKNTKRFPFTWLIKYKSLTDRVIIKYHDFEDDFHADELLLHQKISSLIANYLKHELFYSIKNINFETLSTAKIMTLRKNIDILLAVAFNEFESEHKELLLMEDNLSQLLNLKDEIRVSLVSKFSSTDSNWFAINNNHTTNLY